MAERAILSWVAAADGGRQAPPVALYSTAARFEDDIENWPREAWSVVVRPLRMFPGDRYQLAEVSFLADVAPANLLRRGSRFELLEGTRRVAKGVILGAAVQIPAEIDEFESALIG